MFPSFPQNNARDTGLSYSEQVSQLLLSKPICCPELTNGNNLSVGQFGKMLVRPSNKLILLLSVLHIILVRSQETMPRINAQFVVFFGAVVKDLQSIWYQTAANEPSCPVRSKPIHIRSRNPSPYFPISIGRSGTNPNPAGIGNHHLLPETLQEGFRKFLRFEVRSRIVGPLNQFHTLWLGHAPGLRTAGAISLWLLQSIMQGFR